MIDLIQEEIVKNWNLDKPLVSVRCIAFNEKDYIAQALESLLMQKTDFPFEIVVHDDASKDGTDLIIKQYEEKFPDIIKGLYETENQYSKHDGSFQRIINGALRGKYVAFCEGDDYWIDDIKLQKQVDFLEANPDYGMCYTQSKMFNQKENRLEDNVFGFSFDGFDDLVQNGNKIPTLTVCLRHDLYKDYIREVNPFEKGWLMGDYPAWLYIALKSKVKFFPEVTSVYRVLGESLSHSSDFKKRSNFIKSTFDIQRFFLELAGKEVSACKNYNSFIYDTCSSLKNSLLRDLNPKLADIEHKAEEVLGINSSSSDKIQVYCRYAEDIDNLKVFEFRDSHIVIDDAASLSEMKILYTNPNCMINVKGIKADGKDVSFETNAAFQKGNLYFFNGKYSIITVKVQAKAQKYVIDLEAQGLDAQFFNALRPLLKKSVLEKVKDRLKKIMKK